MYIGHYFRGKSKFEKGIFSFKKALSKQIQVVGRNVFCKTYKEKNSSLVNIDSIYFR